MAGYNLKFCKGHLTFDLQATVQMFMIWDSKFSLYIVYIIFTLAEFLITSFS